MVTTPSGAGRVAARMAELIAARVPFVHATVVRAQCPTSAHPGDAALVLADGTFEGFVGGQCAEGSVRTASLDVLASGEALLLRVLPEGEEAFPDAPGARTVVNPCLSGGALEIFLEPRLPAPLLAVVGTSPIADAVAALAEPLGFAVTRDGDGPATPEGATAVVVSSHGRFEEESIRAALDAGVGLVGLVASHKRGAAVLDGARAHRRGAGPRAHADRGGDRRHHRRGDRPVDHGRGGAGGAHGGSRPPAGPAPAPGRASRRSTRCAG